MNNDKKPELLTIVDDNNEIIGQETREEMRKKGLHSRYVHILIFNKKEEMMICKRPVTTHSYPGAYSASAGGGVRSNESYLDAAKRELKEELAIATDLQEVGDFVNLRKNNKKGFHRLFTGVHQGPYQFDKREIESYRFVRPEQLKKEIEQDPGKYAPSFRLSFNVFVKSKNI